MKYLYINYIIFSNKITNIYTWYVKKKKNAQFSNIVNKYLNIFQIFFINILFKKIIKNYKNNFKL